MAEMGSLLPIHLHFHGLQHSNYLHLRPMLATRGALDTWGGQMLGPEESKRSRRGDGKYVQDLCGFLRLADVEKRLECVRGFCSCPVWHHYDLEPTNRSQTKGRSMYPPRLGNLVRISLRCMHASRVLLIRFSRSSPSICAAVKTSYLPTLTSHSDFTCMFTSCNRSLAITNGALGITVDLLIWNA